MDYTSVNAVAKKSEWLNSFQIMKKLGLSPEQIKADPEAKEIYNATLETLPQKDHYVQALQEKGMKLYEWSEESAEERIGSSEKMSINAMGSAVNVPKAKSAAGLTDGKGAQTPGLAVNFDQACNSARGHMKKQIKELEKLSSKLRFLDTIFQTFLKF